MEKETLVEAVTPETAGPNPVAPKRRLLGRHRRTSRGLTSTICFRVPDSVYQYMVAETRKRFNDGINSPNKMARKIISDYCAGLLAYPREEDSKINYPPPQI